MHWAEKIADRIIKKNPDKEEYVCAAGISPSGSIHIGNFRDIATSLFVAKAIAESGERRRDFSSRGMSLTGFSKGAG